MASKNDKNVGNDDDWETDPDYVNDVSEQTQRWGGRQREAGRFLFKLRMIISFDNVLIHYIFVIRFCFVLKGLSIWTNFGKIF